MKHAKKPKLPKKQIEPRNRITKLLSLEFVKSFYYKWKHILLRFFNITLNNKAQHNYWKHMNTTQYMKKENYCKDYHTHYKLWDDLMENVSLKGLFGYDYGCGGGIFSKRLSDKGAKVIGVDYAANKNYEYPFISEDITKFIVKKKADFVNCCRVLSHIEHRNQDKTLENIKQNLKKRGLFILLESERGISKYGHYRDWKNCLIFHGFKIKGFLSDGVMHCILAEK
ncbi:methyltransferase domain-containing protein [Candidatus Woesearchaeota archaeon]|nr:methyltransferase domain-containing protein [Candidatus Woesearchaeota archaeon]